MDKRPLVVVPLIGLAAFWALFGYECVRVPIYSLFKEAFGSKMLPWMMGSMPFGVFLLVCLYNLLLKRWGPKATLFVSTLGGCGIMWGCFLGIKSGLSELTWLLFVFSQGYIVLIIEQYWSYINSVFSIAEAKKYSGVIAAISSIGAILAGLFLGRFAQGIGTVSMLAIASISFLPAAFLSFWSMNLTGEPQDVHQSTKEEKRTLLGLREFRQEPILLLIIGVVVLTQVLSATITLEYQTILHEAIPDVDAQTSYAGYLLSLVNGVAFLGQFVLVPVLLRIVPVRMVHVFMPVINLSVCLYLLGNRSLAAASLAFVTFKSIDYSAFRITKEILYMPLSFNARYRVKEFIDVFGYRASKGTTSLLIGVSQKLGYLGLGNVNVIGVIAAGSWVALSLPLYRRLADSAKPST